MKLPRLCSVTLLLALFAILAHAAETAVAITPELKGAWVTPDHGWDGRTVLLLHGFADDMDGAGDLTKRLAGELAAHGIASLRINFRGEGDKKRTEIESTFTTRLEDTAAAQAWLIAQPGVRVDRLGVQGWSLGASTAIVTGSRHPAWFRTMAVWSSPSGDAYAVFPHEFPTAFAQARQTGMGTQEIPGWKTVTLRNEFFESFRGVNVDTAFAGYPGAFLSIRGTDDFLPQHEVEFLKIAAGRVAAAKPEAKVGPASAGDSGAASPPAEAVLIAGADHIFHVFEGEKGQSARVIALTVAWFERTL